MEVQLEELKNGNAKPLANSEKVRKYEANAIVDVKVEKENNKEKGEGKETIKREEEEHIEEKGNSKKSFKGQPQLQKWWSNRNDYNKGKKMFRPVSNKNL